MSNYIYKNYYGKYRVLVPIDQMTNDFPRNSKGDIETEDFYIPCKYGEISHYGRNILQAWITSKYKFTSLVKLCNKEQINLINVLEGDDEGIIFFNANDFEFFANELKAKTGGKLIRPFSSKNLPTSDYVLPSEDLEKYRSIIKNVPKEDILIIAKTTEDFITEKLPKLIGIKSKNITADMKLNKMYRQKKEYIHSKGMWDEYLEYLRQNL